MFLYLDACPTKTLVLQGMLNFGRSWPQLLSGPARFPGSRPSLARVHSRLSAPTTFPQLGAGRIPIATVAHNGEINHCCAATSNWTHAREKLFASRLFGDDIKKLLPIIDGAAAVTSGMFDKRAGRMLALTGAFRWPQLAVMMIDFRSRGAAIRNMSPEKASLLRIPTRCPDGAVGRAGV